MYLKVIGIIIICLQVLALFSQPVRNPSIPSRIKSGEIYSREITFIDANGRTFKNNTGDVQGTPFLFDGWNHATLETWNGGIFYNLKIKLDISKGELYFIGDNNSELIALPGYVKEFTFFDSSRHQSIRVLTGFPEIDQENANSFYEVLSEGQVTLLKSVRKKIVVNKNDLSGEVEKLYQLYEDHYVYANQKIQRLKKEKSFILELLWDKKDNVQSYLKDNSINFKKITDLIKVFNFYNALVVY